MLRILLITAFSITITSCKHGESKLVRKNISDKEISIKWYYYSYITDFSPDYIDVKNKKTGETKEFYHAANQILSVQLKDKTIILGLVRPSSDRRNSSINPIDKQIFGYTIVVDTTGGLEDLLKRPDGVKED